MFMDNHSIQNTDAICNNVTKEQMYVFSTLL
jgi:hypothetical protein